MNRSLVTRFKLIAVAVASLAACGAPRPSIAASADRLSTYWFAGAQLSFDRPQMRAGAVGVALDDVGLVRFLRKLGATVSYEPGQQYVLITTGDRHTVSFAIGDASVTVDDAVQAAAFAPYVVRSTVYVPLVDLARALGVAAVRGEDGTTVLQPLITGVDVKSEGGASYVTIHTASPVQYRRLSDAGDEHLSIAVSGVGSTLDRGRSLSSPGLRGYTLSATGSAKNPTTVVSFDAPAGGTHVLVPTGSANTIGFAFAPTGVALDGTSVPASGAGTNASALARSAPAPISAPAPSVGTRTPTALALATASITALTTDATDTTFNVHLRIAGPVTYEWHRLADFRWYVDFKPATLAIETQDVTIASSAVVSLRLKPFIGPNDKLQTVRLGLTLPSARIVSLVPTANGLTVAIGAEDDQSPQVSGTGEFASGQLLAAVPLPPPPVNDSVVNLWKFDPGSVAARNPRLIVIDPGHGGSDAGSIHNGLIEKEVCFDLARRLRTALIARGWLVKLTRESDVDVYAPNDTGREELQARDDIANNAGARLFISIHVNAFTTSIPNGTTTYYYKDDSLGLAKTMRTRLASELPTADDGVIKGNYYVIRHTTMPSILIETAFDSNPADAALLHTEAFRNQVAHAIADGVGDYGRPGPSANTDGE